MDITYDYYRIFYYTAKYGSISKAASVLMHGQPNITKAISNLENQLSCKLFIRSNRGVKLTVEGEKLYRHVEIAFDHLHNAENEILSARSLTNGVVSIATTEIALYGSVLPALISFNRDYPGVKIRLSNHLNDDAISSLKNGIADFAVVTQNINDRSFKISTVKEFKEILCCKKGYLKNDKVSDLSIVFQHPFIALNNRSYSYHFYKEYFSALGIDREADIEVATADQLLPLIKNGLGIGFVAETLVNDSLRSGEIEEIKLDNPPPIRKICLVEDKKRSQSIAAKTFISYL